MTQSEPAPQRDPAAPSIVEITGGADTHKDTHIAAALDSTGQLWAVISSRPPRPAMRPTGWLLSLGSLVLLGIEGTGVRWPSGSLTANSSGVHQGGVRQAR